MMLRIQCIDGVCVDAPLSVLERYSVTVRDMMADACRDDHLSSAIGSATTVCIPARSWATQSALEMLTGIHRAECDLAHDSTCNSECDLVQAMEVDETAREAVPAAVPAAVIAAAAASVSNGEYTPMPPGGLDELVVIADFLNSDALLKYIASFVVAFAAHKTVSQIRAGLGIVEEHSEEELARIKEATAWCLEPHVPDVF